MSSDISLRAILQEIHSPQSTEITLKSIHIKLHLNSPGTKELSLQFRDTTCKVAGTYIGYLTVGNTGISGLNVIIAGGFLELSGVLLSVALYMKTEHPHPMFMKECIVAKWWHLWYYVSACRKTYQTFRNKGISCLKFVVCPAGASCWDDVQIMLWCNKQQYCTQNAMMCQCLDNCKV